MNHNKELLNSIFQNAHMGEETTWQLLGISEDASFLEHLFTQYQEYNRISDEAQRMLQSTGQEAKDLGKIAEVSAKIRIEMKTLADKSPGHIAEMMIQGSTMGIIDATKKMKRYNKANPKVLSLAEKLLHTEESNIEHLKGFLS